MDGWEWKLQSPAGRDHGDSILYAYIKEGLEKMFDAKATLREKATALAVQTVLNNLIVYTIRLCLSMIDDRRR